ncbi:MAG TPA: 30S ribosomal protein S5 [Candidatus Desulfofervidus auxilii]|uniref:Small ribosomal subunit protein uS5 n=1 Tax=Desulfofervidus auxilii TaxID=1621989 RepID=A0A7V0IAY8_DESA2|nr:30S ribosomal protein S5 [Candidatus Desulfofervidus auxilii]
MPTDEWIPKTELGKRVLKGEFESLDEILKKGYVILEPEIVDAMIPDLKQEIIYIGGSPGKGGGIRRTPTKRTARMHKSGRRYKLTALVVVGNCDGIVGIGKASSREHRTAIEKASLQARLNVIRVRRGCGSWECACNENHSIPFKTRAKVGSVEVELMPAPKGVGIVANKPVKKILELAGIKDIWIKALGKTETRMNLASAVFEALKNLNRTKGDL